MDSQPRLISYEYSSEEEVVEYNSHISVDNISAEEIIPEVFEIPKLESFEDASHFNISDSDHEIDNEDENLENSTQALDNAEIKQRLHSESWSDYKESPQTSVPAETETNLPESEHAKISENEVSKQDGQENENMLILNSLNAETCIDNTEFSKISPNKLNLNNGLNVIDSPEINSPNEELTLDDSQNVLDFSKNSLFWDINGPVWILAQALKSLRDGIKPDIVDIPIDHILLEPPGRCGDILQEKFRSLYERRKRFLRQNSLHNSATDYSSSPNESRSEKDFNDVICDNKAFRNPSIYEKLLQYCDIDDSGTNAVPSTDFFIKAALTDPKLTGKLGYGIYNTKRSTGKRVWGRSSYYEELARAQKSEMERWEKERLLHKSVVCVSSTAITISFTAVNASTAAVAPAPTRDTLVMASTNTTTTTTNSTKNSASEVIKKVVVKGAKKSAGKDDDFSPIDSSTSPSSPPADTRQSSSSYQREKERVGGDKKKKHSRHRSSPLWTQPKRSFSGTADNNNDNEERRKTRKSSSPPPFSSTTNNSFSPSTTKQQQVEPVTLSRNDSSEEVSSVGVAAKSSKKYSPIRFPVSFPGTEDDYTLPENTTNATTTFTKCRQTIRIPLIKSKSSTGKDESSKNYSAQFNNPFDIKSSELDVAKFKKSKWDR